MKRLWSVTALAALMVVSLSFAALAQEGKSEAPKAQTLKGEIVDMGCYLGHGAKGAEHQACALKCIQNGMPMGLLTEDGTVYLLTQSHQDADPFNQAKDLAAQTVSITGPVFDRGGVKAIEVDKIMADKSEKSGKS